MEWIDRMKKALDYIEENMTGEISFEKVARLAACSEYHFQRMFSFITDVPIAEYIRRRRLSLAAQELQDPHVKVIDIALKYGYDSPDSFSRAFHKLHGITPSAARELGVMLKAYPRISFYLTLKGDKKMEYKIVEQSSFKVFGRSILSKNVDNEGFPDILAFWGRCHDEFGREMREVAGYLPGTPNAEKHLGAAMFDYKPDGTFRYMITAETLDWEVPSSFEILEIPKMTWAVMTEMMLIEERMNVQPLWKRLPEFFEATGYEHAGTPELEQYSHNKTHRFGEIWVPVINKNKL